MPIFLIIGIFGTILGLIITLNNFNTTFQDPLKITTDLKMLLGTLGGAFVPSFFGVFFTILSIITYNIYNKSACLSLLDALEEFIMSLIPDFFTKIPVKICNR